MKVNTTGLAIGLSLFVVLVGLGCGSCSSNGTTGSGGGTPQSPVVVRYGITPYQDSALPVVAERKGWYKDGNLDVKLIPVVWGDAITALSSGSIDVVIYNFNSFQPPYANASQGARKPVFYCPLYLFKGQALMVHANSGIRPLVDTTGLSPEARSKAVADAARQLRGKKISVTEGTELEQIVLESLKKAGLSKQDVTIIHASPEDGLAAFLSGSVDAFSAGLTERIAARSRGAIELLTTADVMQPVVDGLVTTEEFANKHPEILAELIKDWFKTVDYISQDVPKNSQEIRDYLAGVASTKFTPDQYKIAWSFNVFPNNEEEASKLFLDPKSQFYWKVAWKANNDFLIQTGKAKTPVPESAFWGDKALQSNPSK
jgi:ABC-type nitrate/sulfonate/bicarbonate transport system substrate-binding protein